MTARLPLSDDELAALGAAAPDSVPPASPADLNEYPDGLARLLKAVAKIGPDAHAREDFERRALTMVQEYLAGHGISVTTGQAEAIWHHYSQVVRRTWWSYGGFNLEDAGEAVVQLCRALQERGE